MPKQQNCHSTKVLAYNTALRPTGATAVRRWIRD